MTDLFEADATTTTSLDLRRMQREQRRRERRARTAIVSAVALVIFGIGASVTWNVVQGLQPEIVEVPDYEGAGQGQVRVIVNPGDSGDIIATALFEAGVVASEQAFLLETYANPDAARSISPGYYILPREMKAEYALLALLDSANRDELRIRFTEGWTVEKIIEQIVKVTDYTDEEVRVAVEDLAASAVLPDQANGSLEGWLFPATYAFNPDATPEEILVRMVQTTEQKLETLGVPESRWLEVLTVASLIEREARLAVDRPMIAGVISNRLAIEMALELDSTVHYAVGASGEVFTTAADRAIDNPYNTYRYTGLPPGPIAAPSESSIEAALAPASHEFLFFVTVNLETGETRYATTFNQHLANVEILRQWIADNQ